MICELEVEFGLGHGEWVTLYPREQTLCFGRDPAEARQALLNHLPEYLDVLVLEGQFLSDDLRRIHDDLRTVLMPGHKST